MAKEDWKVCADWLIKCQILPAEHVVASDNAEVFDLAQLLRDGVILCHLANHLQPGAVDPKDFCLRPQMSQVWACPSVWFSRLRDNCSLLGAIRNTLRPGLF